MSPTVAKAAQVRRTIAAIWMQDRGDFADLLPVQAGLDHHLAGELHARRGQAEALVSIFAKTAQTAMGVADRTAEKQIQDAGQHRVAEIAMQPRHGSRSNAALETIAHDQVVAF